VGLLAAALLGRASQASAQSEEPPLPPKGTPLLGSTRNDTVDTTALDLRSPIKQPVFCAAQNDNMGMLGNVPTGVRDKFPNVNTGGRMPLNLAAVAGEASEIGVFGNAPDGVGIWGASQTNIGTWGVSNTGVGVLGTTYPTIAGHEITYPPAGVFGAGGSQVGVWGASESNFGAWGQSNTGIGAAGQSNKIGGWFAKGAYSQDFIDGLEPAALHTTARGADVSACFRAELGVAAMIEAEDGVAVRAYGRLQSDMIGFAVIPRGSDTAFIACPRMAENAHVSLTFYGDTGASNDWVEVLPGKGAILHLDKRSKANVKFSWFVTEQAPPEEYEEHKH
jgi:hypothetical protein